MLGVGLDLVEVERIVKSIERHGDRFLTRVFTDDELAYCRTLRHPGPSYAARFAVKEAVSKAFGTGMGAEFHWRSVGVAHDAQGAPVAVLDALGEALLEKRGARRVLISLTHTTQHAQAIALLVG